MVFPYGGPTLAVSERRFAVVAAFAFVYGNQLEHPPTTGVLLPTASVGCVLLRGAAEGCLCNGRASVRRDRTRKRLPVGRQHASHCAASAGLIPREREFRWGGVTCHQIHQATSEIGTVE